MDLGIRSIRSAGQGSGSIEVTLPASLRPLNGLPCTLQLRDGLRPEIVLLPDLRPARDAFARLWSLLAATLDLAAGSLPLADLDARLQPAAAEGRLAWTDGLALAAAPPHPPDCLARPLRAMARQLAAPLGIAPAYAAGFGAALAQAVAGGAPPPEDLEACEIAASLLAAAGLAPAGAAARAEDAFDAGLWAAAAPALHRLVDLHLDWTADPAPLAALRRAWRQGVALELTGD